MIVYNQRYDDEWVDVTNERKVACCDCGLVHTYEHILLTDGAILRKAVRENRLTAARRRTTEIKASIKKLKGR